MPYSPRVGIGQRRAPYARPTKVSSTPVTCPVHLRDIDRSSSCLGHPKTPQTSILKYCLDKALNKQDQRSIDGPKSDESHFKLNKSLP